MTNARTPKIDCHAQDEGPILRIATVDIETTGLDAEAHELIEISMQWVDVSFVTGRVVAIGPHYADRESPSRPLSAEAREILGVTDDALKSHRFDDAAIAARMRDVDIVVGHRASHDRAFLERRLPLFATLDWHCSVEDIDWRAHGARNASLDAICELLGWAAADGSARHDSQLIAAMLSVALPPDGRTGFAEILDQAWV